MPLTDILNQQMQAMDNNRRKQPMTPGNVTPGGSNVQPTTTPYNYFTGTNRPSTDPGAQGLAGGLMGDYGSRRVSYDPRSAQDYIPQQTLQELGQVTGGLADYTPEKINVGQVETMPVEYYQKQIEDLSKPLERQYERSRELARGEQAARGTLSDYEGYRDIGDIDRSYLEQLGSITRGTQLERMRGEQANQQAYVDRALQEATGRRQLGLQGLQAGGSVLPGVAGMFGELGGSEQERGVKTALQQAGLDANTINTLLGYSADRYGTEAGLFGDIYGIDVEAGSKERERARLREQDRYANMIDLLGLEGYTESPQEQLWGAMSTEMGYNPLALYNPDFIANEPGAPSNVANLPSLADDFPGGVKEGERARDVNGRVYEYHMTTGWQPI